MKDSIPEKNGTPEEQREEVELKKNPSLEAAQ